MSALSEYSRFADAAHASYADGLQPGGASITNIQALADAGFSASEISRFFSRWEVVKQSDPGISGFSAVLLRDKVTDEKVLAIGGTDPTSPGDLLTDLFGIVLPTPTALQPQYRALENFYQHLLDEEKLGENEQIDLVGHSLGGYLAQAFTNKHDEIVSETVTFNTPGFGGVVGQLLDPIGVPGTVRNPKITNLRSDGLSLVAGFGILKGSYPIEAKVEQTTIPPHSMALLSDALAVQHAIAVLDANPSQAGLKLGDTTADLIPRRREC